MVTLQTLYCFVILRSLTSLKIMITEAHPSKIQKFSAYVYVYAPALQAQSNTLGGLHP